MGNIVGEGTPEYVIKQVDIRQEIHGSLNRNNDELVYLNSKTAFVKLVSSVFVSDDINNLGLPGNRLAEQYVLFNGTTNESPRSGSLETYQRSGIARDKSIINNSAYGLGGLEMGIKPMMGITSATIKSENRGSLRTSTVSIIANNKKQFEIIETLYLKLGYLMLLEWGWTNYFNNNKIHIKDNPYSLADDFLLRNKNYDTLLKSVEKNRNESDGNYDAIIGKVINFNWSFTREGTYNITIILRSIGDVIESLKTNILLPKDALSTKSSIKPSTENTTEENKEEPNPEQTLSEFIVSYKDKHSIGKFFYNNTITLDKQKVSDYYGSTFLKNKGVSFIKQQYKDGQNSGKNGITQYYIRFERFLRYIEENLIPTTDNNGKTKFINFDTDVNSNLIYLENKTISTDIRICIFKIVTSVGPDTYYMLPDGEEYIREIGSNNYGKIMNIYFNMGWILTTMDSLIDNEGNVSLYELLKALCNGYNESTGGFNKLHPTVDPDTNEIIFRDEIPLPDKDSLVKNKKTSFFNTFGYNGVKGPSNFVRNLSFNTTISPNLATMITVGATKDGYTPGYDATGLRAINYGTYDAINPKLVNNSGQETAATSTNKKLISVEEKYGSALIDFNKYFYQISSLNKTTIPSFNVDDMNSYKSTLKNIIEYSQLKSTKDNQTLDPQTGNYRGSSNIGFIPFDLQLTIDGLSGIKIYNKIELDTFFLPSSYPSSLEFIIKGVDHTITENDWVTNLSTLAIPRKPYGSQRPNPQSITNVSRRGNTSSIRGNNSLRQVLLNAGYNINSPEYRFAFAIGSREGWDANQNGGVGSRSYRNNNPGNLDYDINLRSIDSGVTLENNPYGSNRFAHFTTAELGAKALVETKIKAWANGRMPPTKGNQELIVNNKGGNKWIKNQPPTIAQFFYTYAPPNENNTEQYISGIIGDLKPFKPNINRNTLVKDIFV
jgi:hypothetical protein